MPKINVYLPDDLAEAVKAAGVPVSAVCQRALEQAVRRLTAVRQTILGNLGAAGLSEQLQIFTDRAVRVLNLAVQRADGAVVGSGHLLAGILTEGGTGNVAVKVLRQLGIDPGRVLADLDRAGVAEPGDESVYSGPAANALELAVAESSAFGHGFVGTEHLLLGLLADTDGVAGQVLRAAGAELKLTRRTVATTVADLTHVATAGESVAEVMRRELAPVLARIERLEAAAAGTPPGDR